MYQLVFVESKILPAANLVLAVKNVPLILGIYYLFQSGDPSAMLK